jgi:hypothetical protein
MKFQDLRARAYKYETRIEFRNSRKFSARFRRATDG